MSASREYPTVLVRSSDDKKNFNSSRSGKPRVQISDSKVTNNKSDDESRVLQEASSESLRSKRSGKPSKRWLTSEIDKLFKCNVQMSQELKTRRDREEELLISKNKLEKEILTLRSQYNLEDMEKLKKNNKLLDQDLLMMKNLVVRLTTELGKSQDILKHLRKQTEGKDDCITVSEDSGLAADVLTGDKRLNLVEAEVGLLFPLVRAYDERLSEKDSLIATLMTENDRIAERTRSVIEENEQLNRKLLQQDSKDDFSYTEFLEQQRELLVLNEQNQLLNRQTKMNHSKLQELRHSFQMKLSECVATRDSALDELQQTKTELVLLKTRFSLLQEEMGRISSESQSKIPISVHNASISECRRLYEELKSKYTEDKEELSKKVALLENSQPAMDFSGKLSSLLLERDSLQRKHDVLLRKIRILESKCCESEKKLVQLENCNSLLETRLANAFAISEELIKEHEILLKTLSEKVDEGNLNCRKVNGFNKKVQIEDDSHQSIDNKPPLTKELSQMWCKNQSLNKRDNSHIGLDGTHYVRKVITTAIVEDCTNKEIVKPT